MACTTLAHTLIYFNSKLKAAWTGCKEILGCVELEKEGQGEMGVSSEYLISVLKTWQIWILVIGWQNKSSTHF